MKRKAHQGFMDFGISIWAFIRWEDWQLLIWTSPINAKELWKQYKEYLKKLSKDRKNKTVLWLKK